MKICPKCNSEMIEGLMVHTDQLYNYRLKWISGNIKKGFWGGNTIKSDEPPRDIVQYSCKACGYIESYVIK